MTINKEQAVSDAMIEAGLNAAGSRRYWLSEDSLSAIYLAMKAASHPLEQQQAVRMREALEEADDALESVMRDEYDAFYAKVRAASEKVRTALQEEGVERRD